LVVTDGTPVASLFDLALADMPDLPVVHTPICAVRLFAGQLAIRDQATNTDLIDLRFTSIGGDAGSATWGNISGDVDDQTDLTDYTFDYLKLNTSFVDGVEEGRIQWNSDDGTLEVGMPGGDVSLQIGQEMLFLATNKTGLTIPDGTPVAINGAQGSRPTITPADASDIDTAIVCGVTTEDIANNMSGYVTAYGLVRDIDTSAFVAGDRLYLSDTTPGDLTTTAPDPPNEQICVGIVIFSNASEGIILAAPRAFKPWGVLDDRYHRKATAKKAADYTLTDDDFSVTFTADAIATLPAATGSGLTYRIIARNGATVTITPDGTDTIAGDAGFTLYDGEDLIITDVAAGEWE